MRAMMRSSVACAALSKRARSVALVELTANSVADTVSASEAARTIAGVGENRFTVLLCARADALVRSPCQARSFSVAHRSVRGKSKKFAMRTMEAGSAMNAAHERAQSLHIGEPDNHVGGAPAHARQWRDADQRLPTRTRSTHEGDRIMRISLLVVMAVLASCSSKGESESARVPHEHQATTGGESDMPPQDAMAANCPMRVQGTTVQAEHVEGGAALVFVTTGDIDALRERVRNMAAARESQSMQAEPPQMGMRPGDPGDASAAAKLGDADEGTGAGGMPQAGVAGGSAVDVDTRVEDIDGGARLVLIATNATDVDALRTQTEQQADIMVTGECPMTPHSMQSGSAIVE
jgi:hypothetical protein